MHEFSYRVLIIHGFNFILCQDNLLHRTWQHLSVSSLFYIEVMITKNACIEHIVKITDYLVRLASKMRILISL